MRVGMTCALAVAAALALGGPAAAHWTRPRTVGGEQVLAAPALASNQRGDAILAWTDMHGIEVAFARRGGRFGKPRLVPGSDVSVVPAPVVTAIDDTGLAVVAWTDCVGDFEDPDYPGELACRDKGRASFRRPGRGLSHARTLSDHAEDADSPQIAARAGHATVVFSGSDSGD